MLNVNSQGVFTLCAHYFHVQMSQSIGDGQSQTHHAMWVHNLLVQEVKEGPIFMEVSNQPQLCPCTIICEEDSSHITSYIVLQL